MATTRPSSSAGRTSKAAAAETAAAKTAKALPAKPAGRKSPPVARKSQSTPVSAKSPDKEKPKKPRLVRDSFTMPENEHAALGEVKKACLKAGFAVKKSELLRVGVALVKQMEVGRLKIVIDSLPQLKAGRPKESK